MFRDHKRDNWRWTRYPTGSVKDLTFSPAILTRDCVKGIECYQKTEDRGWSNYTRGKGNSSGAWTTFTSAKSLCGSALASDFVADSPVLVKGFFLDHILLQSSTSCWPPSHLQTFVYLHF